MREHGEKYGKYMVGHIAQEAVEEVIEKAGRKFVLKKGLGKIVPGADGFLTVWNARMIEAGEIEADIKGTGKILNKMDDVSGYVAENGKLPDNFITKADAKKLGWNPKEGNLADVAPGKSIGGDIFRNKEGLLPKADYRVWYEADINYTSGFRGSDRLLYSSDGLIYKTIDHYKTFTQIK
jgi:hypothetical protein